MTWDLSRTVVVIKLRRALGGLVLARVSRKGRRRGARNERVVDIVVVVGEARASCGSLPGPNGSYAAIRKTGLDVPKRCGAFARISYLLQMLGYIIVLFRTLRRRLHCRKKPEQTIVPLLF